MNIVHRSGEDGAKGTLLICGSRQEIGALIARLSAVLGSEVEQAGGMVRIPCDGLSFAGSPVDVEIDTLHQPPPRFRLSRDVIIALVIVLACLALVALAFISPKTGR